MRTSLSQYFLRGLVPGELRWRRASNCDAAMDAAVRAFLRQLPPASHPQLSAINILRIVSSAATESREDVGCTTKGLEAPTVGELYNTARARCQVPPGTAPATFARHITALAPLLLAVDPVMTFEADRDMSEVSAGVTCGAPGLATTEGQLCAARVAWQPWVSPTLRRALVEDARVESPVALEAEAERWRLTLTVLPSYYVSVHAVREVLRRHPTVLSVPYCERTAWEDRVFLPNGRNSGGSDPSAPQAIVWSASHDAVRLPSRYACTRIIAHTHPASSQEECGEVLQALYGSADALYALQPLHIPMLHAALELLACLVPTTFTSATQVSGWYGEVLRQCAQRHEGKPDADLWSGPLVQRFPCAEALLDHPDVGFALEKCDSTTLGPSQSADLARVVVRLHPSFAHEGRGSADGLALLTGDGCASALRVASSLPRDDSFGDCTEGGQSHRGSAVRCVGHLFEFTDSLTRSTIPTALPESFALPVSWHVDGVPAPGDADASLISCVSVCAQGDEVAVAWCTPPAAAVFVVAYRGASGGAAQSFLRCLPTGVLHLLQSVITVKVIAPGDGKTDSTPDSSSSISAEQLLTITQARGPVCDLSLIALYSGYPLTPSAASQCPAPFINRRMGISLVLPPDSAGGSWGGTSCAAAHTAVAARALLDSAGGVPRSSLLHGGERRQRYCADHGLALRLRRYTQELQVTGLLEAPLQSLIDGGSAETGDGLRSNHLDLTLGAKQQLLQLLVGRYGPEPFPITATWLVGTPHLHTTDGISAPAASATPVDRRFTGDPGGRTSLPSPHTDATPAPFSTVSTATPGGPESLHQPLSGASVGEVEWDAVAHLLAEAERIHGKGITGLSSSTQSNSPPVGSSAPVHLDPLANTAEAFLTELFQSSGPSSDRAHAVSADDTAGGVAVGVPFAASALEPHSRDGVSMNTERGATRCSASNIFEAPRSAPREPLRMYPRGLPQPFAAGRGGGSGRGRGGRHSGRPRQAAVPYGSPAPAPTPYSATVASGFAGVAPMCQATTPLLAPPEDAHPTAATQAQSVDGADMRHLLLDTYESTGSVRECGAASRPSTIERPDLHSLLQTDAGRELLKDILFGNQR